MKKQRICIIGDGLSGLTSASVLKNVDNIELYLISKKSVGFKDNRTTAISESNLKFLMGNSKLLNKRIFWPSKNIELFYETKQEKINFMNLEEKKNNLIYIFQNEKFKKNLLKDLKINKIKIINKKIKSISELSDFDLLIFCLGRDSNIYDEILEKRTIKKDYEEMAVTGTIKHNLKKINPTQFFLQEGPLAILPYKKNHFSFVWSINKTFFDKNKSKINSLVTKKIDQLFKSKVKIKLNNIQFYPIKLGLRRTYYKKNLLILGEGLNTIHPVAGQGFNLFLRDIKKLKDILGYYSNLGISLKNSNALKDFYLYRKPENIIMGLGIDITHSFFKKGKVFSPLKELILKNISKNDFIKEISKRISNEGLIK